MARAVLLALLLSGTPPGPADVRSASEHARPSLVRLFCKKGPSAPGVIIGGGGQVLTSSSACPSGFAEKAELLADGRSLPIVPSRSSPELGVQLLQLAEGSYAAAPVAKRPPRSGDDIVAVGVNAHGVSGALGNIDVDPRQPEELLIDAPGQLGAGVFSLDGKLLGLAVARAPRHELRIAALEALRAWLTGASR